MAAQELGQRVDDDVCAPFERSAKVRRGHRVVDHERDSRLMSDLRHRLDIQHIVLGIAQRFREDEFGLWGYAPAEILRV